MWLFLDDVRDPPDDRWHVVRNYHDCINILMGANVEVISLDHDLGDDKTGYDVVKFMAEENIWPSVVNVHSMNPVGRDNMLSVINRYKP